MFEIETLDTQKDPLNEVMAEILARELTDRQKAILQAIQKAKLERGK